MKIERLAESLRLPQVVPGVQSQVFLCFRVLLLRMSPHHVTSLWPIIVSEMVQVMLHMEHDLSTDTEEFRYIVQLPATFIAYVYYYLLQFSYNMVAVYIFT